MKQLYSKSINEAIEKKNLLTDKKKKKTVRETNKQKHNEKRNEMGLKS